MVTAMTNRALYTLLTIFSLILFTSSCKTAAPKPKPVEKPAAFYEVKTNSDLNIHIRHFTTDKCKQGVSTWVYNQIPFDLRDNYKKEESFVKHHFENDIKSGSCDNTVEVYDEKEKILYFRCGGHSQTVR